MRPVIGITMGDPVGIGPEIICRAFLSKKINDWCKPLVLGDPGVMEKACGLVSPRPGIRLLRHAGEAAYQPGVMDVLKVSALDPSGICWGKPSAHTGRAMVEYIKRAVDLALAGDIAAVVTCPINKYAIRLAGIDFPGHTEMLARWTGTSAYAMMLASSDLRVVLATIHIPISRVSFDLSSRLVEVKIRLTDAALKTRFGIKRPRIAVAGLNPHAGEDGLFGDEETQKIAPAIDAARKTGIDVSGPHPADSLFYHAARGAYDAVICMYHDQGLIPFKMLHFRDGVNTTLGLPIIRTSVDHGTAYDIAGKGIADPGSLLAAVRMAASQAALTAKIKSADS